MERRDGTIQRGREWTGPPPIEMELVLYERAGMRRQLSIKPIFTGPITASGQSD